MATNPLVKSILDRQLESGKFAHAYLFYGPKGTGKKSLAQAFAKKILGTENLPVHPDYSCLDCSADASAEAVREFISRISLKPFLAKRKFSLINNIENLNSQGSNALLKTLEEPPENTVIVLTADTRKVLPTVLSRCQVFNFNPPSLKLRRAGRQITKEPHAQGFGMNIIDFAKKTLSEKLLAVNQFADLEEPELKQVLENFIFDKAASMHQHPESYSQLAAGLKAFEDLSTNKNRKLILQSLMMKI